MALAPIKISELPVGGVLNGTELTAVVQAGETVQVTLQDIADVVTGSPQNLQGVTNAGNTSDNDIVLTDGASLYADGRVASNVFRFLNGSLYGDVVYPTGGFTANRTIKLPNASGNLALSINGVGADATGNITIATFPATAHTHPISDIVDLQEELDFKVTAAGARLALSLTTTGITGAATYNSSTGVFNIPQYLPTLNEILIATHTTTEQGILINNAVGYFGISSGSGYAGLQLNFGNAELIMSNNSGGTSKFQSTPLTGMRDYLLPDESGVFALSVNGTFADAEGNITISTGVGSLDLQSVLVNGYESTELLMGLRNDSGVFYVITDSNLAGATIGAHDGVGSGYLSLLNESGYVATLTANNITNNVSLELPDVTGILVVSVNGTFADAAGDITLSGTQDFQSVTDISGITTNDITAHTIFATGGFSGDDVIINANGTYRMIDGAGNYIFNIKAPTSSTSKNFLLPNVSGTTTRVFALSVNGTFADATGDITISAGTVTSVSGTTNRITVASGTTTPVIDISSAYIGQTSITTLGVITTGTWNGTAIADTYILSASTWNAKQAALSGTGFVKIVGTTISYDNSTYLTQTVADTLYSVLGHTHTFASLTSKPTTIAGYGIADAFTQTAADALYAGISHTHAFSALTSKPTTLSGYGITDALAKSAGAYKFRANNTNATADVLEHTFKDIAEQTYSGTIVWTGTTAPSGSTNHVYSWTQVGKTVTLILILSYATTSTSTSQVTMDLPSDCPLPYDVTGLSAVSSILFQGVGSLSLNTTSLSISTQAVIRRNATTSTNFELNLQAPTGAYRVGRLAITYKTA